MCEIFPPVMGVVMHLTDVPDEVFATNMMGDGVAIEPLSPLIYAPCDGIIKIIPTTLHSFVITHMMGFDVLVHIGLDTVAAGGNGFHWDVAIGDNVKRGDIIGKFDLPYISTVAKSLITPVIILDQNKIFKLHQIPQAMTQLNQAIIQITSVHDNHANTNVNNVMLQNLIKSSALLITNAHGIHARPAAILSQLVQQYDSDVFIEKQDKIVNVKHILSLLQLSIIYGDQIYIYAQNEPMIQQVVNTINSLIDVTEDEPHTVTHSATDELEVANAEYYGIAVSDGVVTGKLIHHNEMNIIIHEYGKDINEEKNIFRKSISDAQDELQNHIKQIESDDKIDKDLLNFQFLLLSDTQLIDNTMQLIEQNKSAVFAFNQIITQQCDILNQSGNKLLIERQVDLHDLRNIVFNKIQGNNKNIATYSMPTILLANELTPYDLINLDDNIVGLISVNGGTTSHVAMLARVKKIPLLIGVNTQILKLPNNIDVILDNHIGMLNAKPSAEELKKIIHNASLSMHKTQQYKLNGQLPSITIDQVQIECFANITQVSEVQSIISHGGSGIGLFRTEFIFLNRITLPTVAEQTEIYSAVAHGVGDMPCIIRTIDIGHDKNVEYIKQNFEVNPALGIRGIRLCLEQQHLLIDQFTAILNTHRSNVKIMLPMISTIEEYRISLDILNKLKQKYNITNKIDLGIMVEVPSVALLAQAFAREVDFFSIGTNDLTQYTMAMDREHKILAKKFDHFHPAVLQSIALVVSGAKKYNRPVSICGLMSSEKLAIPLLIGLGVRQLSMNIMDIARNKFLIRQLNYADCCETAKQCLEFSTASEVREYLLHKYSNLII